jgi:hypothetical protein
MRTTRKDLLATGLVATGAALYVWHLQSTSGLMSSARFLSLALLVLGVAACASGARYATTGRYSTVMSWAAAASFGLAVAGMISGAELPLAALAGLLGLMWLVTTVRHALGIYPSAALPVPVLDGSHEALHPADALRR